MTDAPPLKPIPIKDRYSTVYVEHGQIDVIDNAFVRVDEEGVRTHIPIGSLTAVMLGPGIRISHRAVALAARVGCLLLWVGEEGVRLYASGQPGGARSDRLLYQAQLALDPDLRLKVVHKMFEVRFGEAAPSRRSVDQLRGIEGARVKAIYKGMSQRFGVRWSGRNYDRQRWSSADPVNRALSAATACLYGISEAAILAAGYAPAVGFLHTGKPLSFVYDIADLVKFETVVPVAFRIAKRDPPHLERAVRHACRDTFRDHRLLARLIPLIEEVLAAGGVSPPDPPEGAQPPAFSEEPASGDDGHRS